MATAALARSQSNVSEIHAAFKREFSPAGEHENFLVEQMANARWRLLRFERLEQFYFERDSAIPLNPNHPEEKLLAGLERSRDGVLAALARFIGAAQRSYYKAHRELAESRAGQARQTRTAQDKEIRRLFLASNSRAPQTRAPEHRQPAQPSERILPLPNADLYCKLCVQSQWESLH